MIINFVGNNLINICKMIIKLSTKIAHCESMSEKLFLMVLIHKENPEPTLNQTELFFVQKLLIEKNNCKKTTNHKRPAD